MPWRRVASISRGEAGLTAALLAGLLMRLWLLPVPGSPDVETWKIWAFEGSTDPAGLYGAGGTPPERRLLEWNGMSGTTEYPPAALYELAVMGALYRMVDPSFHDSPTLTQFVKIPGLVADMAFVLAVLSWRHRLGPAATWIAVAFWLNPAVILNGAALGYLDAQMAVPAALAIVAAAHGSPVLAGVLITLAVLTKAQAVFVAPIVLMAVWGSTAGRLNRLGRLAAASVATAAALIAPIVLAGAWPSMVQAIGRLGAHDMLSGNALNIWWIVTWVVRATHALELGWVEAFTMPVRILGISRFMEVGYPNPKPIGAAIVCAAVAWAVWRSRGARPLAILSLVGAWCVYAYAMLNTQVHENHAYLVIPVLALAAGLDARFRRLFWTVSILTALNMYLFYGLGAAWAPVLNRRWTVVDLSVLLSVANVGVFVWFTRTVHALTEQRASV
jgi:hypothetical protein